MLKLTSTVWPGYNQEDLYERGITSVSRSGKAGGKSFVLVPETEGPVRDSFLAQKQSVLLMLCISSSDAEIGFVPFKNAAFLKESMVDAGHCL